MGFFRLFRRSLIDVIEWNEDGESALAVRYAMKDREINNGASLTVRESQLALFVNEGELADLFEPGRHTLTTANLPVLTGIKNWDKGFESPFKSDVYFFSTREQLNQRWGTANPITIRDAEFGAVRIRAHGSYSFRIRNPRIVFRKLSGTRERFVAQELEGQLRSLILTQLAAFLGGSQVAFLDMAANQMTFSQTLKDALAPAFEGYGLELCQFFVQSLSLPDELQAKLDQAFSAKRGPS